MQNAPKGFKSKSQWLCTIYALHYPHPVFLQLLPPCEMSKLLLNLQALGSLPDPPPTQLLPCTHSPVGPCCGTSQHMASASFHVSRSHEAGIIFIHLSIFSTAFITHKSVFTECVSPPLPTEGQTQTLQFMVSFYAHPSPGDIQPYPSVLWPPYLKPSSTARLHSHLLFLYFTFFIF